jgi:mono/diheme cytochrome c family protein
MTYGVAGHVAGKARVALASLMLIGSASLAWAQTAPASDEMIAAGKAIFDAGAGGIPCAACHGTDATAIVAPVVEGRDTGAVHSALANVAAMGSLELTEDQISAVSAYLGSIGIGVATNAVTGVTPFSVSPTLLDLSKAGKDIFESGADGVGCKECHGADATLLVAPNLHGKTADQVHAALMGIGGMEGLVLSEDDLKAVAAYLAQAK